MTQSNRPAPRASAPRLVDTGPSWHELAESRKQRRGQAGLAVRLTCYFFATVLIGIAASAANIVQRNSTATRDGVLAVARASGRALADAVSDEVQANDLPRLQALADAAVGSSTSRDPARIERVEFFNVNGQLIASSDAGRTGGNVAATVNTIIPRSPGKASGGGGIVRLSVSTEALDHARFATYLAFAAIGVSVLAAALAIVWVFVRKSLRPLHELQESVRGVVDSGNLDAAVPVCGGGNDAVFKLSIAFNDLVGFARAEREQTLRERAAMEAAIAQLQEKVASNTAQLEAANGRLQTEIAEKEDFLRAVSHDLNAPLRNIGGMVAMLLMKDKASFSPEVLGRLERIKKNVDIETDLINELLELSRIKTRRQTLEVVDTESIIWDLRGLFENDLKTREIEIRLETSLPTLYAERARVRQVFLNLIDNAIKYMGDGKPALGDPDQQPRRQIRIGCTLSVTEAQFYVADTGIGIHPDDLDKVFCIFRRGRGEATQKVPGKGVGLASVKSIIETYAGRIWVTSTLGQGTTFHFAINGKYVPSIAAHLPGELRPADAAAGLPAKAA